jgi:hypothetical protein
MNDINMHVADCYRQPKSIDRPLATRDRVNYAFNPTGRSSEVLVKRQSERNPGQGSERSKEFDEKRRNVRV